MKTPFSLISKETILIWRQWMSYSRPKSVFSSLLNSVCYFRSCIIRLMSLLDLLDLLPLLTLLSQNILIFIIKRMYFLIFIFFFNNIFWFFYKYLRIIWCNYDKTPLRVKTHKPPERTFFHIKIVIYIFAK